VLVIVARSQPATHSWQTQSGRQLPTLANSGRHTCRFLLESVSLAAISLLLGWRVFEDIHLMGTWHIGVINQAVMTLVLTPCARFARPVGPVKPFTNSADELIFYFTSCSLSL